MSSEKKTPFRPGQEITRFAEILNPEDAEPPILSTHIRMSVRQWLLEIGSDQELNEVGVAPRKSAILSGPPGCGKTTLAHHIGARLGLPVVLVNMASLVSSYVGETGRNVNMLFDAVQQQSDACILFLDEFDAIAQKRNSDGQSSGKERNGIVISLLQKIDRFKGIIIAATNRNDDIDSAIWRRFAMQLEVREPDEDSRYAILARYLSPYHLPEDEINTLSSVTAGASPAVLRQLMEGVKRELVLAPRCNQPTDALSIFSRLIHSVRPHSENELPPLWSAEWAIGEIAQMKWPPLINGNN